MMTPMVSVALLLGSVLGLGRRLTAVSTFADLQAALQVD